MIRALRPPIVIVPARGPAVGRLRFGLAMLTITLVLRAQVAPATPAAEAALKDPLAAPAWFQDVIERLNSGPIQARADAERRLAAARSAHDGIEATYAQIVIGSAYARRNDTPRALAQTAEALAAAERLGAPALLLAARNGRALALRSSSDFAGTLDLYLQNLRLIEHFGAGREDPEVLNGIALCYDRLEQPELAIEFGRRALAAAERAQNFVELAAGANLLAEVFLDRSDRAMARRYLERALSARRIVGKRTEILNVQAALAMLDFREGRAVEALEALAPVEAHHRTLAGLVQLTRTLLNRAEILLHLRRLDEALAYAEEARGYAAVIDAPAVTAAAYQRLSEVREARGETVAALDAARKYFAAQLTVSGEAARQRAAELLTRYDVGKKDQELARLAAENEVQAAEARARAAQLAQSASDLRAKDAELARGRVQYYAFAGGAMAVVVVSGSIVLSVRARRRADRRVLAETEAARLAAEQADALKTRLLGVASHDLKGPLRSLLRSAERIERSAGDPAAVTEGARALRVQGERMFSLVRDLLDLAAIEGGGLQLQRAPLDLARLAEDLVARHRLRAADKEQTLELRAPASSPPPILADAARLGQVLDNLLDNAIKFTPAGGTVTVTLTARAHEAGVAVSDSGPGLAAEDFARMFQPFQTLSAVPTGGEGSTGLGLHIAREIAALHGGRIDVDSAPGAGATFALVLPVAVPPG